jgi:hypothetical protein
MPAPPLGAMAPDGSIQAYLTIFGAPPTPVSVTLRELGLGQRIGRAVVALLTCWVLAAVSVFIVLAHFVLVPSFVVAGLVLAYFRLRTVRVVQRIHGACPRCGVEQDFAPPSWGRLIDCPLCKNQLTLTGLDGEGLPTPPGDSRAS